ncbi:MAG: DUF4190 domain-containing protein [Candidatus Levyibacteriota bacterium]
MKNVKKIQSQRSGYALASLILGIVSFFPLIGLLLGITAIVLGAIGLKKVKEEKLKGKRMAITGIVLGILGILFTIILYGSLFYFAFIAKDGPFTEMRVESSKQLLTQNAGYLELYKKSHGKYPKSLEDLTKEQYAIFPTDQYLRPFYYKVSNDGQSYDLRSLGPDGELNTSDDILPRK